MPTVLESLNSGLYTALQRDPRVYLLGEDILDPYGGAFKATRGLSTAFPERVIATPISEAGITGVATGMALRGLRPVVEIMFGDFVTLIADQVINHAAKFRWMYNNQVSVPLVIRTPMGGRRGYGPTHSQTLEKLFLGIPGLRVFAPSALRDPGELLSSLILTTQDPVFFVENKLLYLVKIGEGWEEFEQQDPLAAPLPLAQQPLTLTIRGAPPAVLTLAAYGYMAELARQAMLKLAFEDEIFCELVVFHQLAPLGTSVLCASLERTQRLLTLEESTPHLGWGSEVIAQVSTALAGKILATARLGAQETPVPASGVQEETALPGVEHILASVRRFFQ